VSSNAFAQYLQQALPDPFLQLWKTHISGIPAADEWPGYIGCPRNSSITRGLLGDIGFQPSTRIARLERSGSGWELYNDGESLLGRWDLVISAVPAPQVLPLVHELPQMAAAVRKVRMEPCWVAALQLDGPLPGIADVVVAPHPALRRIVLNSAKPGRNNEHLYLVQATSDWSQKHLEIAPGEAGAMLRDLFAATFSRPLLPELLFAHRWRYAFAETPLDQDCLWSRSDNFGICGDWCRGRTVEDAWSSAMTLAEQMYRDLS
jgi:predicted NAD/FAD-dependent oxidoreductase